VSTVPRDSSSNPSEKVKSLYSNSDCSPYIIHVYSHSEDLSSKPAHPLLISRTLSQIAYSDIKEIKRIRRGKILAEMKSAKTANSLIQNSLEKENLKAFIPTYRTIRTGIVKDIPQHFDETKLLQFFDSPFKVTEVKRLNRRMRINGEIKYIPSRIICLKFAGQILPKYVFFCRNRYEVFPFVFKVKICFTCYRIGHMSKNCRGKPRCIFCGGDAHDSASSYSSKNDNPSCINCHSGHLATSHDCPMIIKHKMILSLAASENIPLIEAKRKVLQGTTVPKNIVYDYNNFPLLNTNKSNSSNNNSYHSHNQTFNIPQYNRFSVLNTFNNSDDTPGSSSTYSPSSNGFYGNSNPLFSQMTSRPRKKTNTRSQKPSQRNDYDLIHTINYFIRLMVD